MQLSNQDAERLVREGVRELQAGRFRMARDRFQTIADTGRASSQIWLLIATACRGENDWAGEEFALDSLLRMEPRTVRARILKGDCRLEADDEGSALGLYMSALQIASSQDVPSDLAAELHRAQLAVTDLSARRVARREETLASQGAPPES